MDSDTVKRVDELVEALKKISTCASSFMANDIAKEALAKIKPGKEGR